MHSIDNKKIASLVVQNMYESDCLGILVAPNKALFGFYPRSHYNKLTQRDRNELENGYKSSKPYFAERNLHVWCGGISCPLIDFDNVVKQQKGEWRCKSISNTPQIELRFNSPPDYASNFAFNEDDPLLAN